MSTPKVTRRRRRTAANARWTDAEVLALVDAVLVARDSELKDRIGKVLGSRYGVGADRESELGYLRELGPGAMDSLGRALGRALVRLEEDPWNRGEIKQLAAAVGKDLATGRKQEAASRGLVLKRARAETARVLGLGRVAERKAGSRKRRAA